MLRFLNIVNTLKKPSRFCILTVLMYPSAKMDHKTRFFVPYKSTTYNPVVSMYPYVSYIEKSAIGEIANSI